MEPKKIEDVIKERNEFEKTANSYKILCQKLQITIDALIAFRLVTEEQVTDVKNLVERC